MSSPAGTDPALCALLTDAARWGWRENTEIDLNMVEPEAGRERRSRAIATEETGTPRDGVVEGVATATAFAFALVLVFVNAHIRGIDAFSIILCDDVVVVLVRIVREVALGFTGSREDSSSF